MKRGKKIKLLLLTTAFTLSMATAAFASYYTSSVSVTSNAYLSGQDRSYTGSGTHYALGMHVTSIEYGSQSRPQFLVVHNNYVLGVRVSSDTLSQFSDTINDGYTYTWTFPNTISNGTRAYNFNTGNTIGFTADSVNMYNY